MDLKDATPLEEEHENSDSCLASHWCGSVMLAHLFTNTAMEMGTSILIHYDYLYFSSESVEEMLDIISE